MEPKTKDPICRMTVDPDTALPAACEVTGKPFEMMIAITMSPR